MTSSAPDRATAPAAMDATGADQVVESLTTAVTGVAGVDEDTLDEDAMGRVLAGSETAIRRLQAVQARLARTLSRRRAVAARQQRPDDPRAPQKAARAVRTELTDQLGITPSRSKQMVTTGAQLEHLPTTATAFG